MWRIWGHFKLLITLFHPPQKVPSRNKTDFFQLKKVGGGFNPRLSFKRKEILISLERNMKNGFFSTLQKKKLFLFRAFYCHCFLLLLPLRGRKCLAKTIPIEKSKLAYFSFRARVRAWKKLGQAFKKQARASPGFYLIVCEPAFEPETWLVPPLLWASLNSCTREPDISYFPFEPIELCMSF